MKKKLLTIALAVVLALGCFAGLMACGTKADGTYYMYMNGEKVPYTSVTFEGGKVTQTTEVAGVSSSAEIGTYKVEGDKVILTSTISGQSGTAEMEIVSDGVLKAGPGMYYCKDGKTPPAEE